MTHTPDAQTASATQTADCADAALTAAAPVTSPLNTGFTSLINAAKAAAGKAGDQPRQSKLNLNAHTKKIGPVPNGSRRSMGKR